MFLFVLCISCEKKTIEKKEKKKRERVISEGDSSLGSVKV